MNDLSIAAILAEAFERFKKRVVFYISLLVIYVLFMVAMYLIGERIGRIGRILVRLVEIYINAGLLKAVIKDLDGKEPELIDLFTVQDVYISFLVATILYGLIVGVGSVLLIIPGVILAIMFQFYKYGIVDKKMGPIESLSFAKDLIAGYKWQIFLIDIVLILINVLGLLALGVGLLITIPVTVIAEAVVYKKLLFPLEGMQVDDTTSYTA